jgi:hypothetical protein
MSTLEAGDYFAACRARIPAFTRRHFGVRGTVRLHREALGFDLLRSPLNVLLVGPALFLQLGAMLARWLGLEALARWLATRRLFMETRLSRRIGELVAGELLGLERIAPDREMPAWAKRTEELLSEYIAARHAVAELAAGAIALVIGLFLLQALTPGALSLGPMLAQEYAERSAIESFWAGSWVGQFYYGWWPAEASWPMIIGTTILVMVLFAIAATFMGLFTDPIQQALGLHAQRLHRLVDTLERHAKGEAGARLALPDPYIARLGDVVDWVSIGLRMLR